MLKTVLDVAVPVLAFLLMFVVGLELTTDAFRRVARSSGSWPWRRWPSSTLAARCRRPARDLPAEALRRGGPSAGRRLSQRQHGELLHLPGQCQLALAVTLTAVSCLVAVLTMPLLLAVFKTHLDDPATLNAPVPLMIGQLLLMLILPILLGMFVPAAGPASPSARPHPAWPRDRRPWRPDRFRGRAGMGAAGRRLPRNFTGGFCSDRDNDARGVGGRLGLCPGGSRAVHPGDGLCRPQCGHCDGHCRDGSWPV